MSTRALSVPSTGPAQPNQAPSKGPANPMAPLAALCAIARFHQVAADPATLAHQLGLSANQILTTADLIHAVFYLSSALPLQTQRILLQVVNGEPYQDVTIWLDDRPLITLPHPPYQVWWPLEPGPHQLVVTGLAPDGNTITSPAILFTVHDVADH